VRNRTVWILSVGLVLSSIARAENKLFITDVLDSGQMESQGTLRITQASKAPLTSSSGTTGTAQRRTSSATASFGAGIGEGLQLDATLPYVLTDKQSNIFNGVTTTIDKSGIADLDVGIKYRLAGAEDGPHVISARIDIKPDTADSKKAGTGTTNILPQLAMSFRVGKGLRPYGVYQATFRNHGQGDTHTLRVGAEKEFSETTIVTLEVSASINTASDTETTYNSRGISLSSYLQIGRNLYLIPALGFSWFGANKSINGSSGIGSNTVTAASLGIYYLF
jgi:hypothetical protein